MAEKFLVWLRQIKQAHVHENAAPIAVTIPIIGFWDELGYARKDFLLDHSEEKRREEKRREEKRREEKRISSCICPY